MIIEQVDRTIATQGSTLAEGHESVQTDDRRINKRRPAVAMVRSLVVVALAAFAILWLLPAVIAAQVASAVT